MGTRMLLSLNRFSINNKNHHNRKWYFSDRAGSGIHPDFQTSYKTGDVDMVPKQIEEDVKNNEVFVFIKGTPAMPQCGFSKNLVTILNYLEVGYETRDVLSHPALRGAIKEYSDWPTFPQLYCKGELIGGHDIVVDMFKSGELHELLGVEDPEEKESNSAESDQSD